MAAVFSVDVWKLLEREVVKLGNSAPKVANAFLLACAAHCSCVVEERHSASKAIWISSLGTGPQLEEPNLAEHPPTSGELKKVPGAAAQDCGLDSQEVVVARRE